MTAAHRVPGATGRLWLSACCRHCDHAPALEQVNAGHTDGCRSMWVGACPACRRTYVVTASIAQASGRGVPGQKR